MVNVRMLKSAALVAVLFLAVPHKAVLGQTIFDATRSEQLVPLVEDGVVRFLKNSQSLPDRYAVQSRFRMDGDDVKNSYSVEGVQILIVDTKQRFRLIDTTGRVNGQDFHYETFWNGEERWMLDDSRKWNRVYKFGSQEAIAGQPHEDRHGNTGITRADFFDPLLLWAVNPEVLWLSLRLDTSDFIGPNMIQATRLNRDQSVSGLFAKSDPKGPNYITEVTFPRQGMPAKYQRFAAVSGAYSAEKAKVANKGASPVIANVKWFEFERDAFVPTETVLTEYSDDQNWEAKFEHQWLMGAVIDDRFIADPRGGAPLEELKFDGPVKRK